MRPSSFGLILTPLLLALTGCPGESKPGTSGGLKKIDQETLVTIVTADDAKVLDPHVTSDGGNVKVINQIYETLVGVDSKDVNTLIPELAESWVIADDAKSIVFTIRSGVTFQDGTPLDAAACKLSLDRLRKNGWELPSSPYASMFSQVEAMKAEGQTLTISFKLAIAPVALRNYTMFNSSIVSPKVLETSKAMADLDAASLYVTQHAAGTGGYKVDTFDPAAKVTRLVAYDGYWGGAPKIQTLVFKSVPDEAKRMEYLGEGKRSAHIVVDDVPRQHWEPLKTSEFVTLHTWWSLNVCYMGINGHHEATKELEVRQAIQLGVDREQLLPHYEGTARPTYSLVAQPMAEYDAKLRPAGWDDDLEKRRAAAKALLEKVGAVGREVTIYFPNQPRPYLPRPQKIADTVRHSLNAIGLKAKIQGEDKNKLFPGIPSGEYELVLIGWTTDNGHPDNFYSPLADGADGKPGGSNVSRVFDAEIHEKILKAQQLQGADAKTAYREIERLLQNKVGGYAPLVNTKVAIAYSKSLSGFEVNELAQYRFTKATLSQ
jgi:peptide/nickel transport system substrate-binding protein